MPIEIRELHIRVAVENKTGPASGPDKTQATTHGGNRNEIIAECVEEVMRILADSKVR